MTIIVNTMIKLMIITLNLVVMMMIVDSMIMKMILALVIMMMILAPVIMMTVLSKEKACCQLLGCTDIKTIARYCWKYILLKYLLLETPPSSLIAKCISHLICTYRSKCQKSKANIRKDHNTVAGLVCLNNWKKYP